MSNNSDSYLGNHDRKIIDEINAIMDSIRDVEDIINIVSDTFIVCGGEIIDTSTFSIMSLPSTQDILDDL